MYQLFLNTAFEKASHPVFKSGVLLVLTTALFVAACEDNPARSDNGDHANAVGFVLKIDDSELVHYFAREYTFNADGELDTYIRNDSTLYFHSGNLDSETLMSENIRVIWLDQNRNPIVLHEYTASDGDWEMRFEIFEPGSRSVPLSEENLPYQVAYDKEQSTWQFQLEALKDGRGDLRIMLWHIDHADMLPVPLPIEISVN